MNYKSFIQKVGIIGITNIFLSLSSIILLPILTKNYSINDYGIWIQIYVTISLIPNIVTLGLPYAMIRFLASEKDNRKIQEGFYSITFLVTVNSSIISIIFFIFSGFIGKYLLGNNIVIAKILALIIFIACLNNLLLNFYRTFQKMALYSLFTLIQTFLNLLLVIYFTLFHYPFIYLVIGLLLSQITIFLIMTTDIISKIGFQIPRFTHIKTYLSYSIHTIPSNVSYWIVDSSDRYLISIILGIGFVGYYSPGYTLGSVLMILLAPIYITLTPVLSNYYDKNNIKEVKTILKYSLKYYLAIAIPSVFGLSLLSKTILTVLSTPAIALNGYLITPLVALGVIFYGVYGINSQILFLKLKTKILGIVWITSAILNITLNLILIPHYGIIGAAFSTLIAYFIAFITILIYSLKLIKFDLDLTFITKSIISATLMSVFIILISPKGIINTLFTIVISILIYTTLIFLLKGIKIEEIKFIKNVLK